MGRDAERGLSIMDKLEKVIKGLGCLAGEYDMENNKCAGCGKAVKWDE